MHSDIINIALAFIEGFALIASPCILPILPIILSGSLSGSRARPIGIILGFALTFTFVTLFSRLLLSFTHMSPDTLRNISFVILIFLGIVMLSSYLTEKFNLLTSRLANIGNRATVVNSSESGFFAGLLFGGLVGIIWTPCAGPILAAVIVQVVVQTTTLMSVLTVLSFALGAGLPMLLIALTGRQLINQFSFIRNNTVIIRKILGLIIIATVLYLFYDAKLSYSVPESKTTANDAANMLQNGVETPYPAPQIDGIDAWINSQPLKMSNLKGKVVLIDFWTYSCINCIRTLPYLKNWYAKYHAKGLVIIGVHSPEFQFEHDYNNVKAAVEKDAITYPVALDNHFTTWQNYRNEYWPAHYLIAKNGNVVYQHFGEGEYDVTENNIQYLLGIKQSTVSLPLQLSSYMQTPETYFGYARAENFASLQTVTKDHVADYSYPQLLLQNQWALQGKWIIYADKIVSASAGAAIKLHFFAGKVYAVMGMNGISIPVRVKLNNKEVGMLKGDDVSNNQIIVKQNRLYTILNTNGDHEGTLELTAQLPGLEMYTFTFGE